MCTLEANRKQWGKREYNKFCKWMNGQTCLEAGAYIIDIITYADQRNKGIKDPHVWD